MRILPQKIFFLTPFKYFRTYFPCVGDEHLYTVLVKTPQKQVKNMIWFGKRQNWAAGS